MDELTLLAQQMMREYIVDGGDNQVNLPSKCRKEIESRIAKGVVDSDLFDQAQNEIVFLMSKDSFGRYHEQNANVLPQATQEYS